MEIGRIEGATRELGKPVDWNEFENGKCSTLPIRDIVDNGVGFMVSAWKPSVEEMQMLIQGESIQLWIQGKDYHPVVALSVGVRFE